MASINSGVGRPALVVHCQSMLCCPASAGHGKVCWPAGHGCRVDTARKTAGTSAMHCSQQSSDWQGSNHGMQLFFVPRYVVYRMHSVVLPVDTAVCFELLTVVQSARFAGVVHLLPTCWFMAKQRPCMAILLLLLLLLILLQQMWPRKGSGRPPKFTSCMWPSL